jgi:hypothetical protein
MVKHQAFKGPELVEAENLIELRVLRILISLRVPGLDPGNMNLEEPAANLIAYVRVNLFIFSG